MTQLADLRRYAIARSLRPPASLAKVLRTIGFVQADPIRAPARAQDLILRHRVQGYRAGDLEKTYEKLSVDEEYFVNYGFMHSDYLPWLHPRAALPQRSRARQLSAALLAFVRERSAVHPKEAAAHFKAGRVRRWSGSSAMTTHLLDRLHFLGDLRVVRRENGIRIYAARSQPLCEFTELPPHECAAALIDLIVRIYAPVPAPSLVYLCRLLLYATPHLEAELKTAVANARQRFRYASVAGMEWYWPGDEDLHADVGTLDDKLRVLAPFDPIVWDRRRFELCWGWQYRFEAYMPASKRRFGYYALPVLWHDRVIGWANVALKDGTLRGEFGYPDGSAPKHRVFARELDAELDGLRSFLDRAPLLSHEMSAGRAERPCSPPRPRYPR
jgi:uncharacterized protein